LESELRDIPALETNIMGMPQHNSYKKWYTKIRLDGAKVPFQGVFLHPCTIFKKMIS
jgi:hypothetical protein